MDVYKNHISNTQPPNRRYIRYSAPFDSFFQHITGLGSIKPNCNFRVAVSNSIPMKINILNSNYYFLLHWAPICYSQYGRLVRFRYEYWFDRVS